MSLRMIVKVWETAYETPEEKLVALYLADAASDQGEIHDSLRGMPDKVAAACGIALTRAQELVNRLHEEQVGGIDFLITDA